MLFSFLFCCFIIMIMAHPNTSSTFHIVFFILRSLRILIWDFEPASTARSYGEIKEFEKFEVGHKWTKMTLV